MKRTLLIVAALASGLILQPASAQSTVDKPAAPKPPAYETRKVDGTDNVYIFRAGNAQAMFVVTPQGVIATDPISYSNPKAAEVYLEEIRKITQQPVRYVVYSHHHYDHIAGGKPFKDAGAKFVAHKRAQERLARLADPNTVLPDETVDDRGGKIELGGTTLELHYIGLNHSDSTLIMRLPKERLIFAVDLMPVGSLPGRAMIDSYPLEWQDSLRKLVALEWDRLIPGHPGLPAGRLGTKQDVQDILGFLDYASAEVQVQARAGKCWEPAEKEVKLSKYESWPGYQGALPVVVRRYCGLWGRGT